MRKITLFIMLAMISAFVVNAQSTKTFTGIATDQHQATELDKQIVKERIEQF